MKSGAPLKPETDQGCANGWKKACKAETVSRQRRHAVIPEEQMENRLRLFSDLFNNGAAGSCWPAPLGPWQEQTATTLLIVCCWQSSGTQRGFWRGACCFGKLPLPPASRALLINVSAPENSSHSVLSTWLWSQHCCSHWVHPVLCMCCGTERGSASEAAELSQGCSLVLGGETEAQLCCHTDTKTLGVQHTSPHSISSCPGH